MSATHHNNDAPAASSSPGSTQTADGVKKDGDSYGQILKSTGLIGGSSVLSIAIRVVQTKAMAVMLGPAGFGLMGLYSAILDLALAVASMGIGSSGVRQIAESVASDDHARIARTVIVLRRTAVLLGILGALLVVAFCRPLSTLTFGTDQHAGAVALLGLAVFFRSVAAGQGALIQGMRRIADLAAIGVVGSLLGAVVSIAMVYFMGEEGVAPALVGAAAMGLLISWRYSRKVAIQYPVMTLTEVRHEASALLKLGFAFMASGILMMGAAYAARTIVLRMEGFEAAGFYSAAWTLGGLYVGIILQAMGADFYPRLVGAAQDNPQCNRLVNEQTRVSLLLAAPGVIATLTFAPLVIALFYSSAFGEAVDVLRWICLGIALRVITWPIGYIIVAKNRQMVFLGAEIAWTVVNVGLTWLWVKAYGLNGAGIAFCGSYVFHGIMIYLIVARMSGFRWSTENLKLGLAFLLSIGVVFCSFYVMPGLWATALGILLTMMSSIYSMRILLTLVPFARLPRPLRNLLVALRFARS
jgi:enterobacterial common antigen flippase